MKFIFLGTGTSQGIPVIGCKCSCCSSSDPRDKRLRTAGLFQSESANIVFDAGPDFRMQMLQWGPERLDAIFITHEHNDHIAGLDDIRPYNFIQKKALKVYALPRVARALRKRYDYIFHSNPYPGAPSVDLIEILPGIKYSVGDILVEPLRIMHGKFPILGYKIDRFAYLTDVKSIPGETLDTLTDLDVMVISALRHKTHHAHITMEEALIYIRDLKPKRAFLTHLSHEMGKHQDVKSQLPEQVKPGYDGLHIELSI